MAEQLFSQEAEQSVIGGIFVAPVSFDDVLERISDSDFAEPVHRLIFKAIHHTHKQQIPIDIITVSECLAERGHLPGRVEMAYLAMITQNTPSAANVLNYASIVRNYSQRRKIIMLASQLTGWAQEERDCNVIMSRCRKALDGIDTGKDTDGPVHIKELMARMLNDMVEKSENPHSMTGISTGFPEIDRMLDGLKPGSLYVIAGRPSMGKSVMGINFIHSAVKQNKSALLFTLEMSYDEVLRRLCATEQGLNSHHLQRANMSEDEWSQLCVAAKDLSEHRWWIDETPDLDINAIVSRARRLHRSHPLSIICVDYIGLIKTEKKNRHDLEIGEITRALKVLSKELSIPVIALSQLNRDLEKRPDKRPIMSDLRDSGSIEQDADVVITLYRDEWYDPKSIDKDCAEIMISKNRSGRCGMVPLRFEGHRYRFLPLPEGLPSAGQPRPEPNRRNRPPE
jgi:replicative DNA helicase